MNQKHYRRYREMAFYGPIWLVVYVVDKIATTGNWWFLILAALALLWFAKAGSMVYRDRLDRKKAEAD